uniref:GTPase n=1 Tax=Gordonia sp. B7-2 TaxID=3420932 RepID=UPI003D91B6D1
MGRRITLRGRIEQLLDEVAQISGDAELVSGLRAQLAHPLTVALVGRVSSGKSTLLNALVGDRVAPTDRAECTQVATLYAAGSPQRIEVIGLDGSVEELPGPMRGELGRAPEEIDHAVAYIPSRLLRDTFQVIDTPGLSGFTDTAEIATRRVFGGGSTTPRGGLPRPDVILFLLDDAAGPKDDEVEFLQTCGASAQNTILVLSQADLIAADAPMVKAQEIARRIWRRFGAIAVAVVAISGLMAEAGVCGLTERETAQIARRGQIESWELLSILDGSVPPPPGVSVDDLARVEELVGAYAMDAGAEIAAQGAQAFCDWCHHASGLAELRLAIGRRFVAVGDVLKARTTIAELRAAAYRSPNRDAILGAIEDTESTPEAHRLREVAAVESLARWQPDSDVIGELTYAIAVRSVHQLLSLPPGAPPAQIEDVARQRAADARARRSLAASSAEREALLVLEQTYQLVRRGLWAS